MHNQVYMIGRLVGEPATTEKEVIITLRVKKPWKNENGEYETEDFEVFIPGYMGSRITEFIKPGILTGIRGRLRKAESIEVIADKVSMLGGETNED